jgi:protein-L-isoaspartate(D-aspartate) O-methyltransferase
MSDDTIREARRWFAEELRYITRAGVKDLIDITRRASASDVIQAFATVPRERFVGPGPLRILSPWSLRDYWTPADASLSALYHDVLIAYDEQRRLNNGQPSLWAFVFDKLNIVRGERVRHLGCGMGYYTAILAELVGPTGEVSAIEIDEPLAEGAREALAPWPQVTIVNGDGANASLAQSDVVAASAGATHPLPGWLRCLSANGRLVFPMTVTNAGGGMLLVRRRGRDEFAARFLCRSRSTNLPALATQRLAIVLPKHSLRIAARASSRFARIGTTRTLPAGFMAMDGASRVENLSLRNPRRMSQPTRRQGR